MKKNLSRAILGNLISYQPNILKYPISPKPKKIAAIFLSIEPSGIAIIVGYSVIDATPFLYQKFIEKIT
ncbi:MAG: hypothetical protein V9E96_05600 [Chitinophagaceae bacterium]